MITRRKRLSYMLIAIVIIILIVLIRFIVNAWTPVKYTVRLEFISEYPNTILVKEAGHNGTGWERVGDEHGLYKNSSLVCDIILIGNQPPYSEPNAVNVYLCEVNYLGQDFSPALGESAYFDKYEIVEWYPIYPVKRDTILPSWLYPKNYLSKHDLS